MRHAPGKGVFQTSYLDDRVNFNTQMAFLEEPTDDGLTRVFRHMSLTCNPNAPVEISEDIAKKLPSDPKLVELKKRFKQLSDKLRSDHGYIKQAPRNETVMEREKLRREITTRRKYLYRQLSEEHRRQYFYNSHNEEMRRQLHKSAANPNILPDIKHQLAERRELVDVMCDLSTDISPEKVVCRRIRAINLLVALGSRQEIRPRKQRPISIGCEDAMDTSEDTPTEHEIFPSVCKKTQCVFCIGNEKLSLDERTRCFSRPSAMMDHVEKSHLRRLPHDKPIACNHPVCKSNGLVFYTVEHFKNHVQTVHDISLRA
jgi:hypothetical protein